MSMRLQVLLDEKDLQALRANAAEQGMTLSEWVRQTLRTAMHQRPGDDVDGKLACVRAAVRHEFPTGDIDQMLSEIEEGYGSGSRS
jgi:hypothetical protein